MGLRKLCPTCSCPDPSNAKYSAHRSSPAFRTRRFTSSVSGLDNGEEVKFYAADGKYIGQAVAANGTASYAVSEALVIAKVGNNSIKIAIK